jgi:hypothetical protein
MDQHVYILCALLYAAAVCTGMMHAEAALVPPRVLFRAKFHETPLRTGDVLLWISPSTSVGGDLMKLVLRNSITHVNMVFVDKSGTPFIWETMWHGNRVEPLFRYLQERTKRGHVCLLRKLTKLVDSRACEQFIRAHLHKPYSYSFWRTCVGQVMSLYHFPSLFGRDDGMFCSQLVAATLQHLGALDFQGAAKSPATLLPADFAPDATAHFPWIGGYNLGPYIKLEL